MAASLAKQPAQARSGGPRGGPAPVGQHRQAPGEPGGSREAGHGYRCSDRGPGRGHLPAGRGGLLRRQRRGPGGRDSDRPGGHRPHGGGDGEDGLLRLQDGQDGPCGRDPGGSWDGPPGGGGFGSPRDGRHGGYSPPARHDPGAGYGGHLGGRGPGQGSEGPGVRAPGLRGDGHRQHHHLQRPGGGPAEPAGGDGHGPGRGPSNGLSPSIGRTPRTPWTC